MFIGRWCIALTRECCKGSRSFSLWTAARARVKVRATSSSAVPHAIPPVSLKLIARCGLFTFVSVNALFVGTVICDFENWRRKSLRAKDPNKGKLKKDSGFITSIRRRAESILGRQIIASDVYWGIVICNLLVFLGHRSPLGPFFLRRFVNSPYGPTPALSMLLSVFSHYSALHLGINMYVLHSFANSLVGLIGAGDFFSLFVGGGVFGSFLSVLGKAARRSHIPSLGASGGICAVLGAFCMLQPHARLCVPFVVDLVPHSFEARNAAWTLLLFEFVAAFLLASRSPIDHAAHLGGLVFGMYYGLSGSEGIWRRRTAIVSWWRELRGK